jgi:hypothetical protein
VTPPIDRQQPLSAGQQLGELVIWMRAHPIRAVFMLLLAAGTIGTLLNPQIEATPNRLSIGDCIYARTSAATDSGPGARPVGNPAEVEAVVMSGGAERAACGLSHGHEVSLVVELPELASPQPGSSGAPEAPDRDAMRADLQGKCDAAFPGFVRHDLAGSEYLTFAAVPTEAQYLAGSDRGVCLVARADGQWMLTLARDSGQ